MPFVRSLDRIIVDALNRLASDKGSWWKTLLEDPKVFIAIRRTNSMPIQAGPLSEGSPGEKVPCHSGSTWSIWSLQIAVEKTCTLISFRNQNLHSP